MMNEKTSSARVVLENIPCAIFLSLPFFPHPASLSFSLSFSLVTPGTNSNKRTSSAHGWSYAAWKMENTPRKHDPPRPSETRCRGGFCRWRVVVVGWDNASPHPDCELFHQVARVDNSVAIHGWMSLEL